MVILAARGEKRDSWLSFGKKGERVTAGGIRKEGKGALGTRGIREKKKKPSSISLKKYVS